MLSRNFSKVYKKGLLNMSELYKRIDTLCLEHGVSITTMCKASGASRASLSDLKVGRKQNLSAETLSKIAAYFSVSVDYLLGLTNNPKRNK
jgi:transcriptional regulator with XRE-family HTH domain